MTCNVCAKPNCIEDHTAVAPEFTLPAAPKLADLTGKECTVVELQAALVHLIDLFNEQGKVMSAAIANKQDREWRATI